MHGRDHRPGGSDPIPGFGVISWARLDEISGGSLVDVPSETNVQVPLNTVSANTDSSLFDTGTANQIKVLKAGLYSITARTAWNTYALAFRSIWVLVNS